MPANRQHLRLTRVERLDDFTVIGHGINRLLIYFLYHVAFLEIGGTRVRIDRGYDNTMNAFRQIELAREIGRQFAHMDPGEGSSSFIFFARRLLSRRLLWHNAASLPEASSASTSVVPPAKSPPGGAAAAPS